MKIDLHMHSSASDGALPPAQVVERARAGGLDVIALADHDTVAGVPEALEAARSGGEGAAPIHVIPAIEISATHRGRDIHVLGYGIDLDAPEVQGHAHLAADARAERLQEMVDRLQALGVPVEFDAVLEEADGAAALARPHLARVLWKDGHVGSIAEAFDRYIGDDGPAFVPVEVTDVAGAIERIHQAGGLAVWAHPPLPLLGAALRQFVDAGLDGLECHRPRVGPDDLNRLLNKARSHQLLVTGGSDWHGDWHPDLGSFWIERDTIAPFLERFGL